MIQGLCFWSLKMGGWTFVNKLPDDLRSFVFIGAPHTSNVDFIPAMAVAKLMNRKASFVIKNEWLKTPVGFLLKTLGAIGIDREAIKDSGQMNSTDRLAMLFKQNPDFILMISPEGTRKPNANWKSGFYYIAQKAGVPIVLGYADYAKKELGIGAVIYPQNFEQDMQRIMEFYQGMSGKNLANFQTDQRYSTGIKS